MTALEERAMPNNNDIDAELHSVPEPTKSKIKGWLATVDEEDRIPGTP